MSLSNKNERINFKQLTNKKACILLDKSINQNQKTNLFVLKEELRSIKLKTIAYLRVSTVEQDLEKNKHDILTFANDNKLGHVEFIEEKISGTVNWKDRKIFEIINNMIKDDNLIVSELSRLARSTLQILEILDLARKKGINIYAIKGCWKLDNSMQSKIISTMFAMMSEIERDLISERTKEALKERKLRGIKLGRPKGKGKSKLDIYETEILSMLNYGVPKSKVAEKYNTSVQNLYNWLESVKS